MYQKFCEGNYTYIIHLLTYLLFNAVYNLEEKQCKRYVLEGVLKKDRAKYCTQYLHRRILCQGGLQPPCHLCNWYIWIIRVVDARHRVSKVLVPQVLTLCRLTCGCPNNKQSTRISITQHITRWHLPHTIPPPVDCYFCISC